MRPGPSVDLPVGLSCSWWMRWQQTCPDPLSVAPRIPTRRPNRDLHLPPYKVSHLAHVASKTSSHTYPNPCPPSRPPTSPNPARGACVPRRPAIQPTTTRSIPSITTTTTPDTRPTMSPPTAPAPAKDGLSVEVRPPRLNHPSPRTDPPPPQDLTLPKTMVNRLAKGVLPPNTQIQREALQALHKSATVFVSYVAGT